MSTFTTTFSSVLEMNGMKEFSVCSELFENLFVTLTETNKMFNLTAVTDELGVSALHFADSLMAIPYLKTVFGDGFCDISEQKERISNQNAKKTLLDVGCGAGFPSLPIAIACPELGVTGLDSTAKKVDFSNKFACENGLINFKSVSARAEDAAKGKDMRERFDVVTARAVSRLNVLAEITLPFVKNGEYFLAMKGAKGMEELEEAKKCIELLGGKIISAEEKELILPEESQKRTMILIKKVRNTENKYPRPYAKIVKSPLK